MARRPKTRRPSDVVVRERPRAAIDLLKVRWPGDDHRLDRHLVEEIRPGRPTLGPFETVEAALTEDLIRARLLRASAGQLPGKLRRISRRLARRLEASVADDVLEPTAASAQFMRQVRVRLLGELWAAVDNYEGTVRGVTLIPPMVFSAKDLLRIDGRRLVERMRAQIQRALPKVPERDGFLVLFVHGEFTRRRDRFLMHFHGVAGGDYVDAIETMRKDMKDRRRVRNSVFRRSPARRPIKLPRLINRPRQISYVLQGFWPMKNHRAVATRSPSRRRRIPGVAHTVMLLWLHRHSLSDLRLVMGDLPGFGGAP